MRTRLITFACLLLLHAAATAASRTDEPAPSAFAERSAFVSASAWLTDRLHRPIAASQILSAPETSSLEGCAIAHIRPAPTGATAVSLRCPGQTLPQLLLLDLSAREAAPACNASSTQASLGDCAKPQTARKPGVRATAAIPPLVRAGAALHADWRTPALHAELPVVALDSGSVGAEIRVRVVHSERIFRAHILTAATVSIVEAGA